MSPALGKTISAGKTPGWSIVTLTSEVPFIVCSPFASIVPYKVAFVLYTPLHLAKLVRQLVLFYRILLTFVV